MDNEKREYSCGFFGHRKIDETPELLETFDDTYFPEKMRNAGKASYIKRNQEMINHSRFCVVYFDENYVPPRRKTRKEDLTSYQPRSGTKVTYAYATRKKREIINLFTRRDEIEKIRKITEASF